MHYEIKRNDTTIANVRPESGEQKKEIMLTDTVSMSFTLAVAVQFAIGDTVQVYGENYKLNDLPEPEKASSIKHQYSLIFQALWYDLSKPLFFFYDSLNELWQMSEFQIMVTADSALDLVIANANREQSGWIKGDVDATTTKQLPFTGEETVLQALTQIAQAFELEWWIFNKTIHLTKKGSNNGYHFEYGRNKGLRGGIKRNNVDTSSAFSRLYVRGSDQNLPADYRGGQKRLMLPDPMLYIQGVKYGELEIERSVTFDDIKPERTGTVTAVGDIYTFIDDTLDFDINAQLMAGISAKVIFQTGQCAGYQFEIAQGGYNDTTKAITILKNDAETDLEMPSDLLKPAVGDEYILVDIIMPDSYRADAEERLLAKGQDYFNDNAPPKLTYTVPPDYFFFERNDIQLNLGDYIHMTDTDIDIDKDIRITSFTRDLHNEFKYTSLLLSDVVKGSIINGQFTQAENIAKAQSLTKLTDIQKARWNWKTTNELTTLLNTIRGEMLLVMMDGGAYTSNIMATIAVDEITTTAGRIVHSQYTQGNGVWEVSALTASLPDDQPYYVYIKAGRSTGTAVMVVSETKISVESDPLYYYFPFGVASSIVDGGRIFTTLRGYTKVTGDTLSLGRITANDTGDYWDLNTSTFNLGTDDSGLTYSDGQLTVKGSIVATGASFVNLIVQNLKTATTGHKRIEIDATNNNIKLIDASNNDLLVIDDDAAIVGYTINPDPPFDLIPVYGAGIMVGSADDQFASMAKNGFRTSGSVAAKSAKFDREISAQYQITSIYKGDGSLPADGYILATGDCNLYTTPDHGQVQTIKNLTSGNITLSAAETSGRNILLLNNTQSFTMTLSAGNVYTFRYYQPDNYWIYGL